MKKIINTLLCLLIVICITGCEKNENENTVVEESEIIARHPYELNNNGGIEELDLAFLKLTNEKTNEVYSPLSIKYALAMLNEGAEGDTKAQIESILNDYEPKKYVNSKNLSLANLFAIRDTLADNVSEEFKTNILEKYNADVFEETFENPNKINSWIAKNTLGMIENLIDSYDPNIQFLIINALAMDMEWINIIQNIFNYDPVHENYSKTIYEYDDAHVTKLVFNNETAKGIEFTAIANKYDIISELGENTIRQTVKDDIVDNEMSAEIISQLKNMYGGNTDEEIINNYLDVYINEISLNYGKYGQSTDFYFYTDDKIKVFAKDLKEYDGTQFQYIGIMPKEESLSSYIEKLNSEDINNVINNLIEPSYDIFEEGYITEVEGIVPSFDYTYDLDLNKCLNELGVTDIFDINKANLSKIVGDKTPIQVNMSHKSTIDFSNDGIKAAAVTYMEGLGASGEPYDYIYDVPIKKIDLTFNKPFLYLIRNKDTGEIWFVGSVYKGNATDAYIYVRVDYISVRKDPSSSSEKIGAVKLGDSFKATGKVVEAEGYTWYEIETGGWIADNGERIELW